MATTTVADARSGGPPQRSRQLARLLRYVLPYLAPFLASVALMALVGLLDAFRVLPSAPFSIACSTPAPRGAPPALQSPGHGTRFQSAAGHPVALPQSLDRRCFCAGGGHGTQRDLRLRRHVPRQLRRLRHDHRRARRFVQCLPAQFGGVLFQTHNRHAALDDHQQTSNECNMRCQPCWPNSSSNFSR